MKLWNVENTELVRTLKGHGDYVRSVAFSPDGKRLASGSYDSTVKVWDVATGTLVVTLRHNWYVNSVASAMNKKNHRWLASGSDDGTAKIWDLNKGAAAFTLMGHTDWVTAVAFSTDGKVLASSSTDKTVKLWDASTGKLRATLSGHATPVHTVAFSPNGKRLASSAEDSTVKVWNIQPLFSKD